MKIIGSDPSTSLPEKKLTLVLDLDQTLIHVKYIADLSPDETYLLTYPPSTVFTWGCRLLKLRPSARSFIKEASKLFHLCIYTMGNRSYALGALKFLDPEGAYIDTSNVFSQEDCVNPGRKGLNVVKRDERVVIVIDDNQDVWEDHRDNLIHIDKYQYFACSSSTKTVQSSSETGTDENGDVLSRVLDVLRRVHLMFFYNPDFSDVRVVMREMRQGTLKGCIIVLSMHVLLVTTEEGKPVTEMVEEMGGTWCCLEGANSTTTHVISTGNCRTARWAVKKRKFLVTPLWIRASYYSCCRQMEDKFQLLFNPL